MKFTQFHMVLARMAAAQGILGDSQIFDFKTDADETVNFLRQLEKIDQTIYEEKYPALRTRDWVSVAGDVGDDGAATYTFRAWDKVGMAALITNYSADLPSINALGKEVSVPMRDYGSSYEYTITDMKRAGRGFDLPSFLPRFARQVVETKLDKILAIGDAETPGLYGLFNNPNVSTTTPTTGSWTASTSIDLILDDVEKLLQAFDAACKGVHSATHVILPRSTWRLLGKHRSTTSDITGYDSFKARFPGVTLDFSPLLETAGAGSTKRVVIGEFNSINQAALIPREFTQEAPQQASLAFVVPCHAKCGGVVVRFPLSLRYMDGV